MDEMPIAERPAASQARTPPANEFQQATPLPHLDVTIEHDSYVAGQINVVRLLITNSYEQAIEILSVKTPQSSSMEEYKDKEPSDKKREEPVSVLERIGRSFISSFSSISVGGVTIDLPRSTQELVINAEPNAVVKLNRPIGVFSKAVLNAQEGSTIEINPDVVGSMAGEQANKRDTLQPRSTVVIPVSVRTRQWLLFTPQRFGLNVEIVFRLGDTLRSQVINTQMDIRPPLSSMICGAVSGGFLGSLVASLNRPDVSFGHTSLHCLTAVLMSSIAAVSLSRRGNTQAFVTVEDFFGGFFVGSLIGYGGVAYFERAVLPPSGASTGVAAPGGTPEH